MNSNTEQLIKKALRFEENAKDVITRMAIDNGQIEDYLVTPGKDIVVFPEPHKGLNMVICDNVDDPIVEFYDNIHLVHPHALSQLASKNNLPGFHLAKWSKGELWEQQIATNVINDHFTNKRYKNQVMLRTIDNTIRAYVSDKFDRYNSTEVFKEFIQMSKIHGARVSNAYYNDISSYIEVLIPEPITINDEDWVYAVQFRNSDFGGAAMDIRSMLIKLICTNGITRQSMLRQIHRGSTIESSDIKLGMDTIKANTEAKKLLIRDYSNHIFSKDHINQEIDKFEFVNRIAINIEKPIAKLPKFGATKEDIENIRNLLMENHPETGVAKGGNVMRVANAISYLANEFADMDSNADKIASYKDMAGKLITSYEPKEINV